LIPRLIDKFPADALRLFLSVSVDNREQRDRLAVDILTPERLAGLLQPASPEWQVLKVVSKLITLTESLKATAAGRFAVVGFCVRAATEHRLDSDWREVASQLRGLISSLPESHQRSLMTSVPPDRREWCVELFGQPCQAGAHPGSGTVGPVPVAPPTGVEEPSASPKQPGSTATVKPEESAIADDLDADLAKLLAGLRRQVATIERAERELAVFRRERLDLRLQLDQARSERARVVEEAQSAKRNLEDSHERMAQKVRELGERDRLAAKRLEEAQQGAAEHEREVARQREEFAADRAAWVKRVEVNANGRLAEFRNALGESLSRVIGNLPPRNSPASLDLCTLLLTRLYEILSELERKDIHVRLG
jgi:hypothetical protein